MSVDAAPRPVRRIWAQAVQADAAVLEARLHAITAEGGLSPAEDTVALAVADRLAAARAATTKSYPMPGRLSNWWRGTLVEASFQNLHAAEALLATIYPPVAVWAEVPEAAARAENTLGRDDPRWACAWEMYAERAALLDPGLDAAHLTRWRECLRKTIEVGFSAADLEHTRLRNFRNAVVGGTVVLSILMLAFVGFVYANPSDVSFCFVPEPGEPPVCPTGGDGPQRDDVLVIALLGMLGGLLSGIVSIKNMLGTSIAYDVPQALAWLKLPLGALSAVGGLLVIRGQFIPGLSNLDTSDQILAYAFALGVAQQLLVGMIDKQAQDLLGSAPGKASGGPRPPAAPPPRPESSPTSSVRI
jgi:hypothetical protein